MYLNTSHLSGLCAYPCYKRLYSLLIIDTNSPSNSLLLQNSKQTLGTIYSFYELAKEIPEAIKTFSVHSKILSFYNWWWNDNQAPIYLPL